MATQPIQPAARLAANRCAICGNLLTNGYYTLLDRDERYCPTCIATRPRCDSCGVPLNAHYWQLHDGRRQCANCHTTAVYDPTVAHALYDETVAGLITQLGLVLNVGVEFRLVDAPALHTLRARDSDHHFAENERVLGLYQRQGRLRVIYMLYGLPRLLFRTTVAHEYAHAWQGEHCPLLKDDDLREGFAEWVAYRHLIWLGCTKAARRMLDAPHPYRPAFESILELERQLGTHGVIEHMKRVE